ncbi:hypothetical protein [Actinomadura rugatobispora]|uniref:Serine/threonine protein kinase n=1 Tax=Actinomadura rugatobispora TaxID=1994 RepID=A0ABW1ADC6_9ACTN
MTPPVPPARRARPSSALGARETSGVQVRLGTRGGRGQKNRGRDRSRDHAPAVPPRQPPPGWPGDPGPGPGPRPRRRRRKTFAVAGLVSGIAAAALVAGAIVLLPRSTGVEVRPEPQSVGGTSGTGSGTAPGTGSKGRPPRTGTPVEVGTADGSRYRIAAVTAGADDGGVAPQQSSAPVRASSPYIDYVLTNPSRQRVLLDFPGDVFLRRALVAPQARGRCMWQAGVPETMCTPPIRSEVVRTLSGGRLEPGDGGDRYMPPGASYLVRATVDVPVAKGIRRSDLRLYIWKQLYMADRLAKEAPFPR